MSHFKFNKRTDFTQIKRFSNSTLKFLSWAADHRGRCDRFRLQKKKEKKKRKEKDEEEEEQIVRGLLSVACLFCSVRFGSVRFCLVSSGSNRVRD